MVIDQAKAKLAGSDTFGSPGLNVASLATQDIAALVYAA
jgi:hypothetical protein